MSLDGCANEFSRIDPGNRESIGRLTVAVQQRLRPFACHAMRDHHAVADVLQETLLTMIERLGRLKRSENLWPWIYRIAWNKVQDHLRDRRRRRQIRETLTPGLPRAPLPTAEPDALGSVLQDEALARLGSALEQLSDRCRAVIFLRFHERTPYTQIAESLVGHLATITSEAENDFVFGLIDDDRYWFHSYNWRGPWIGGVQPPGSQEPDGNWTWVTGEPFTYAPWDAQQPNNFNGTPENRIAFGNQRDRVSTWNDFTEDFGEIVSFVVEFPRPEPSAAPRPVPITQME